MRGGEERKRENHEMIEGGDTEFQHRTPGGCARGISLEQQVPGEEE